MIAREDIGSIAVLRLEHGKVSALDIELCDALAENLSRLEQSSTTAVVLTGTGSAFSAGVDLIRLVKERPDYVREFVPKLCRALQQLFLFPKPVVAAVNGHAIAGGCIIAAACDYRVAAKGSGKIGVPEALVGVPFPPIALEIIRFAAEPKKLQEIAYFGRYYEMEEGLHLGLIDEIVPPDKLQSRALEVAEMLARIPPKTFGLIKTQLRTPSMINVERLKVRDPETMQIWTSDETRETVRDYLKRTIGK